MTSNNTNGVAYAGKAALETDGLYRVSVVWYSSDGSTSDPVTGDFEMGPLDETDWAGASWVGLPGSQQQLHWSFAVPTGTVTRASLAVDAPGCAVVVVNGVNINGVAGMCQWTEFTGTVRSCTEPPSSTPHQPSLITLSSCVHLLALHEFVQPCAGPGVFASSICPPPCVTSCRPLMFATYPLLLAPFTAAKIVFNVYNVTSLIKTGAPNAAGLQVRRCRSMLLKQARVPC